MVYHPTALYRLTVLYQVTQTLFQLLRQASDHHQGRCVRIEKPWTILNISADEFFMEAAQQG